MEGVVTNRKIKGGMKQTEVGVIPIDWSVRNLGDITTSIASGKSDTKSNYGDYPIYGSTGLIGYNSKFDYSGETILVARVGANAGTVNTVTGKYCVSDNTLIIELGKSLNFRFIQYYLKYYNLNKLVYGSGQPLITGGQLKLLKIPLPPTKAEQTAIATALSDADALIQSLEKLIAKKRLIKQGAMQELLKPKEGWVVKKLGEVLEYEQPTKYLVTDTKYNENNEIPVLTAGKSFILGYTNEREGLFDKLPVIIFDDFTTASKYVDFPFKVKSSALKILKLKNRYNDLRFTFEAIQLIRFSLGDHKRYWISEFQHLDISMPDSKEQKRIGAILNDMDAEIAALESKLEKYKQIKQGMMQNLLTGKIRLV